MCLPWVHGAGSNTDGIRTGYGRRAPGGACTRHQNWQSTTRMTNIYMAILLQALEAEWLQ